MPRRAVSVGQQAAKSRPTRHEPQQEARIPRAVNRTWARSRSRSFGLSALTARSRRLTCAWKRLGGLARKRVESPGPRIATSLGATQWRTGSRKVGPPRPSCESIPKPDQPVSLETSNERPYTWTINGAPRRHRSDRTKECHVWRGTRGRTGQNATKLA